MSIPREPGEAGLPAAAPDPTTGSWPAYRDRMITTGRMTAPVRWAGLATPLDRAPGVFVVADQVRDDERVLAIGHAHDLRAHFADTQRIAPWHDGTAGHVVIYTIPNSAGLGQHRGVSDPGGATDHLADD